MVVIVDALWTTLWVDGHAGPVTGHFTSLIRGVMWRVSGRSHRILSLTGPIVLITTVLTWALLLWGGWVAMFSASHTAVVDSQSGAPATLVDRIYFAAYSLFTMGNGDYRPAGGFWKVATGVASMTGLFFFTLSVTYLLAVIEAVVVKRSFAGQVTALGKCAEEFVIRSWDGRGFPAVDLLVMSLAEQLNLVTEQHHAYPLLHYYHESQRNGSVPVGLAVFDDVLTLFLDGIPPEHRPAPGPLLTARGSVDAFLDTLDEAYIDASDEPPPLPDLNRLRQAGIPVTSVEALRESAASRDKYRRLLMGFLEDERRPWPSRG
ncbi:MAG TPA: potassium channel family protein [Longimicrobiaceae bacterium]